MKTFGIFVWIILLAFPMLAFSQRGAYVNLSISQLYESSFTNFSDLLVKQKSVEMSSTGIVGTPRIVIQRVDSFSTVGFISVESNSALSEGLKYFNEWDEQLKKLDILQTDSSGISGITYRHKTYISPRGSTAIVISFSYHVSTGSALRLVISHTNRF